MRKTFYMTVGHADNPEDNFFITWVNIDAAFNVDWDISTDLSGALAVDTLDKAKAFMECMRISVDNNYNFKIIEIITHD